MVLQLGGIQRLACRAISASAELLVFAPSAHPGIHLAMLPVLWLSPLKHETVADS